MFRLQTRINLIFINILIVIFIIKESSAQYRPYRCSNKLEKALEEMLRRNQMKSGSRTQFELTPYSVYHSLYDNANNNNNNNNDKNDPILSEKLDNFDYYTSYGGGSGPGPDSGNDEKSSTYPLSKVEVAELRVRLPSNLRWVVVDKCQFSANNRTLDTRLIFPDLTISGKVVLHPTGGHCSMILRLRKAGIEFRTIPLNGDGGGFNNDNGGISGLHDPDSRRTGTASIRTDSHFSEPGFLSVFAHGCQGPSGIKVRQNSKRRHFEHNYNDGNFDDNNSNSGRYFDGMTRKQRRHYQQNFNNKDTMNFNEDILDYTNDNNNNNDRDSRSPKTFSELFNLYNGGPFGFGSGGGGGGGGGVNTKRYNRYPNQQPTSASWHNAEVPNSEEISDALSNELEHLFSMGVRGLLTSYMQKALQPAIKETLMENMGYTLSYG